MNVFSRISFLSIDRHDLYGNKRTETWLYLYEIYLFIWNRTTCICIPRFNETIFNINFVENHVARQLAQGICYMKLIF